MKYTRVICLQFPPKLSNNPLKHKTTTLFTLCPEQKQCKQWHGNPAIFTYHRIIIDSVATVLFVLFLIHNISHPHIRVCPAQLVFTHPQPPILQSRTYLFLVFLNNFRTIKGILGLPSIIGLCISLPSYLEI